MKIIMRNIDTVDHEIEDLGILLPAGIDYEFDEPEIQSQQLLDLINQGLVLFVDSAGTLLTQQQTLDWYNSLTSPQYEGFYTKLEVDSQIAALVSSAPTTLDTLNELAAALGNDPNFATTVTNELANKADISHLHDDRYSLLTHDHATLYPDFAYVDNGLAAKADINHNHDGVYSPVTHNHDGVYSDINHNHDNRYVLLSDYPPVYGSKFLWNQVSQIRTTSSTAELLYLALPIVINPGEEGSYRFHVDYSWNHDDTRTDFIGRWVFRYFDQVAGTWVDEELATHREEPKDAAGSLGSTGTDQVLPASFTAVRQLQPGNYLLMLYFASSRAGRRSSMIRAYMEALRVAL